MVRLGATRKGKAGMAWHGSAGQGRQYESITNSANATILYGFFVQYRDDKQRELGIQRRANGKNVRAMQIVRVKSKRYSQGINASG